MLTKIFRKLVNPTTNGIMIGNKTKAIELLATEHQGALDFNLKWLEQDDAKQRNLSTLSIDQKKELKTALDAYFMNSLKALELKLDHNEEVADKEQEMKGLEWTKVSLRVLNEALIKIRKKESDFALEFKFFNLNAQGLLTLRVILYNLDILYRATDEGRLEVIVTDTSKPTDGPGLHALFDYYQKDMLSELTKCLVNTSLALESHF